MSVGQFCQQFFEGQFIHKVDYTHQLKLTRPTPRKSSWKILPIFVEQVMSPYPTVDIVTIRKQRVSPKLISCLMSNFGKLPLFSNCSCIIELYTVMEWRVMHKICHWMQHWLSIKKSTFFPYCQQTWYYLMGT